MSKTRAKAVITTIDSHNDTLIKIAETRLASLDYDQAIPLQELREKYCAAAVKKRTPAK